VTATGDPVDFIKVLATAQVNAPFTLIEGVQGELVTPLPATLPLFAGGLGVIGLLARRKRRKTFPV